MAGRFDLTATQMITKGFIEGLARMALQVPVEDVSNYVDNLDRIESFAPIFEPSDYMAIRGTLPGHMALAKAFLRFRQEVEKLKDGEV